jgi:hypothetical protein
MYLYIAEETAKRALAGRAFRDSDDENTFFKQYSIALRAKIAETTPLALITE